MPITKGSLIYAIFSGEKERGPSAFNLHLSHRRRERAMAVSESQDPIPRWDRYLTENSKVYRELAELRRQGWQNSEGDTHFANQRQRADNATAEGKTRFFRMMEQIGEEMNSFNSILTLPNATSYKPLRVLDLCFAPGGFSSTVLRLNPGAIIRGTTLPPSLGGHEVQLPEWETHPRLRIKFCDITMRAGEMSVDPAVVPEEHPDRINFDFSTRLFVEDIYGKEEEDEPFDLVICDGQVLRTHASARAEYREHREASRLTLSQLVISMQRLQGAGNNGRLVMLLHKPDALDTALLLRTLSTFAQLKLFKPRRKHALRSSFYVLATEVHANSHEAAYAISVWKKDWTVATFGTDEEWKAHRTEKVKKLDIVQNLMTDFGRELIRMAEPVWDIQASALKRAPFMTKRGS
ncbi:hypothetical protein F4776DRAFT_625801 [Hypoxylon sp. NC0597]|nr:hypothetical protein F4776DRAFT_625801 [Hypoxylon sp. NC0597]